MKNAHTVSRGGARRLRSCQTNRRWAEQALVAVHRRDFSRLRFSILAGGGEMHLFGPALVEAARTWAAGVRTILELGSSADGGSPGSASPLVAAICSNRRGRGRRVSLLLAGGAKPDLAGRDGNTPLIEAALAGSTDIVRQLLNRSADINHRNRLGESALTSAVAWRHYAVAEQLLRAGADPDASDKRGGTALMLAAMRGQRRMVELLLAYGARPERLDAAGNNAAKHAVWYGRRSIAARLEAGVGDQAIKALRRVNPNPRRG